ncbi:MAG: cyclic nucleotide-binding/CBS domain-containing protein [Oligoflexales bacterium]
MGGGKLEEEEKKSKEELFKEFMTKGANNNVAMVPQEASIRTIVELMVANNISSVLLHDQNEDITGIITEKDIVKKFTLLDFENKLDKNALTLATRPVLFVNQQTYQEDIVKIHLAKRIHHFPITNSENSNGELQKTKDIVGIVSIGDFLRKFVLDDKKDKKKDKNDENAELIELFFLNGSGEQNSKSIQCLEGLGVKIKRIINFHAFYQEHQKRTPPIMFDIDSFPIKESKNLIKSLKKYLGPCIFITQNAALIQAFRMHLNPEFQVIALKPIDYCYFYWLLKQKWAK